MEKVAFYAPVNVLNFSGMVRIGNELRLSGQGGWNEENKQFFASKYMLYLLTEGLKRELEIEWGF